MEVVFIAFRLKPGRDDDLIDWITNAGEGDRSYHIRESIRRGLVGKTQLPFSSVNRVVAKQVERNKKMIKEEDLETALDSWI